MADYSKEEIKRIEGKWRTIWDQRGDYRVSNDSPKPKYYVLDMFPYPSGAGLHVGHPLGYIASDIVSRYKRLKGFNVLHPMGFDAFGLPAEQYAIQTGQHPRVTTEKNISTYRSQLSNLGFSYDWSRKVDTSDPSYYKWTQWIFMQLFNSWYNRAGVSDLNHGKAEPIATLIAHFEKHGNQGIQAYCDEPAVVFSAKEWQSFTAVQREDILQRYRIAYLAETMVNWCAALGTVLSNDEVKDGVSERGGYPVERLKMLQWNMRISAYAERLLSGLDTIDWPEPVREMQKNWIGKSVGCELDFPLLTENASDDQLAVRVFTTRIDTIYGVTFMVIAPEHELVEKITTKDQRAAVTSYVEIAKNRSERERMSEVKRISGVFTGAYVKNPFNGEKVPVWVADYVLAGYGTGAVMAVPCSDTRDYAFAKHFDLPVIPVLEGPHADITKENFEPKSGKMINSDFLNGLLWNDAIEKAAERVETMKIGVRRVNYRMRDAIFGRQRYWGEPFPVYFKDGIPTLVNESDLPVTLPEIDAYKPTETGEPPLGRAKDWNYNGYTYELTTMPGWAGSSWYWFRYMDPQNDKEFCGKSAQKYWRDVDLYIGGSEHATGHLLYSRFWCKALKDLGYVDAEEPFLKLINQGHIQGVSKLAYRINGTNTFVSYNLRKEYEVTPIHVDISIVNGDVLDIERFKAWRDDLRDSEFKLEAGQYICGSEVEKMSKRYYNVVNPDDIVSSYGADTLRMYEMFLGPLEISKPWNTHGIDGVYKFLRRFWNLFHDAQGVFRVSEEMATQQELKVLHKTLKKVAHDIEQFSFNTSVSEFMICSNELNSMKCNKRVILEPLVIALAPFAPHLGEELWQLLGHTTPLLDATFPIYDESYLKENAFEYPISINGKVRAKMNFALDMPREDIEKVVLASEAVQKWTEGKAPKKIIVVPGRIVNVVI
ncbi:leucine--tRNA ligase [Chryseolinea sp. T2]|uniref:leucine--tRNA ligase n=1 Tax=Chryseolinea sp. T2 TaxID=3129255 RepID=UPI00307703A7